MYRDEIFDHFKHPRNQGALADPDFAARRHNPLCGDQVTLHGCVASDSRLEKLAFEGRGCAISIAAASLLTEQCKGHALDAVLRHDAAFMQELLGLRLGPMRLKCALLPLEALHAGIAVYRDKKKERAESAQSKQVAAGSSAAFR